MQKSNEAWEDALSWMDADNLTTENKTEDGWKGRGQGSVVLENSEKQISARCGGPQSSSTSLNTRLKYSLGMHAAVRQSRFNNYPFLFH